MDYAGLLIPPVLALLCFKIYSGLFGPLSQYPGPALARYTNLWRFFSVWNGAHQVALLGLHKKHGKVVRIGPNHLSLSNPQWIPIVYSSKAGAVLEKSDMYSVADVKLPNGKIVPTTFSIRNEEQHAEMAKPYAHLYGAKNVLTYERRVDAVLEKLKTALDVFASEGEKFDLGNQMTFTAWDLIKSMIMGSESKYLDSQTDFDGTLKTSIGAWAYFASVSQLPWLDRHRTRGHVANSSGVLGGLKALYGQCLETINQSSSAEMKSEASSEGFLSATGGKGREPAVVAVDLSNNIVQGSDTTAIALKSAIFYTLRHTPIHRKLQTSLSGAADLASDAPSYSSIKQNLPFLTAVVQESLRIHPPVGLNLERVVPSTGLQLPDGQSIPAGTVVGMNAHVLHFDEKIFGQDAMFFNPHRWLPGVIESQEEYASRTKAKLDAESESEAEYAARIAKMNAADLAFGAGPRACPGREMAMMEMHKVLATLFSRYEMELVDPDSNWKTTNSWLLRQGLIWVTIKKRGPEVVGRRVPVQIVFTSA